MEIRDLLAFEKFIAPTIAKFVYWIGLAIIIFFVLTSLAGIGLFNRYTGASDASLGGVIFVLALGTLGVLVWRICCELWVVVFSINDRLGVLTRQATGHPLQDEAEDRSFPRSAI